MYDTSSVQAIFYFHRRVLFWPKKWNHFKLHYDSISFHPLPIERFLCVSKLSNENDISDLDGWWILSISKMRYVNVGITNVHVCLASINVESLTFLTECWLFALLMLHTMFKTHKPSEHHWNNNCSDSNGHTHSHLLWSLYLNIEFEYKWTIFSYAMAEFPERHVFAVLFECFS